MLLQKKISIGKKLYTLFKSKKINEDLFSEIEELLISSDFGIEFTDEVVEEMKGRVSSQDNDSYSGLLKKIIKEKMTVTAPGFASHQMNVVFVFGVNGTGKTTTVGKLACNLKGKGKKILIAAADTYRDAAIEQLSIWSSRAGVPLIKQYQGSDPGAVVYDACDSAISRRVDFLLIDTAGRLHTREKLMEELVKIGKILDKKMPETHKVKLLTIDATTGQNAISQASLFNEYVGVDGIILTKLDSSAKGGIACSISGKLKIPIFYTGTGEKIEDLAEFDVNEYLDELFALD